MMIDHDVLRRRLDDHNRAVLSLAEDLWTGWVNRVIDKFRAHAVLSPGKTFTPSEVFEIMAAVNSEVKGDLTDASSRQAKPS